MPPAQPAKRQTRTVLVAQPFAPYVLLDRTEIPMAIFVVFADQDDVLPASSNPSSVNCMVYPCLDEYPTTPTNNHNHPVSICVPLSSWNGIAILPSVVGSSSSSAAKSSMMSSNTIASSKLHVGRLVVPIAGQLLLSVSSSGRGVQLWQGVEHQQGEDHPRRSIQLSIHGDDAGRAVVPSSHLKRSKSEGSSADSSTITTLLWEDASLLADVDIGVGDMLLALCTSRIHFSSSSQRENSIEDRTVPALPLSFIVLVLTKRGLKVFHMSVSHGESPTTQILLNVHCFAQGLYGSTASTHTLDRRQLMSNTGLSRGSKLSFPHPLLIKGASFLPHYLNNESPPQLLSSWNCRNSIQTAGASVSSSAGIVLACVGPSTLNTESNETAPDSPQFVLHVSWMCAERRSEHADQLFESNVVVDPSRVTEEMFYLGRRTTKLPRSIFSNISSRDVSPILYSWTMAQRSLKVHAQHDQPSLHAFRSGSVVALVQFLRDATKVSDTSEHSDNDHQWGICIVPPPITTRGAQTVGSEGGDPYFASVTLHPSDQDQFGIWSIATPLLHMDPNRDQLQKVLLHLQLKKKSTSTDAFGEVRCLCLHVGESPIRMEWIEMQVTTNSSVVDWNALSNVPRQQQLHRIPVLSSASNLATLDKQRPTLRVYVPSLGGQRSPDELPFHRQTYQIVSELFSWDGQADTTLSRTTLAQRFLSNFGKSNEQFPPKALHDVTLTLNAKLTGRVQSAVQAWVEACFHCLLSVPHNSENSGDEVFTPSLQEKISLLRGVSDPSTPAELPLFDRLMRNTSSASLSSPRPRSVQHPVQLILQNITDKSRWSHCLLQYCAVYFENGANEPELQPATPAPNRRKKNSRSAAGGASVPPSSRVPSLLAPRIDLALALLRKYLEKALDIVPQTTAEFLVFQGELLLLKQLLGQGTGTLEPIIRRQDIPPSEVTTAYAYTLIASGLSTMIPLQRTAVLEGVKQALRGFFPSGSLFWTVCCVILEGLIGATFLSVSKGGIRCAEVCTCWIEGFAHNAFITFPREAETRHSVLSPEKEEGVEQDALLEEDEMMRSGVVDRIMDQLDVFRRFAEQLGAWAQTEAAVNIGMLSAQVGPSLPHRISQSSSSSRMNKTQLGGVPKEAFYVPPAPYRIEATSREIQVRKEIVKF